MPKVCAKPLRSVNQELLRCCCSGSTVLETNMTNVWSSWMWCEFCLALDLLCCQKKQHLGLNVPVITSVNNNHDPKMFAQMLFRSYSNRNKLRRGRQWAAMVCFNKTASQRSIITDNVLMFHLIEPTFRISPVCSQLVSQHDFRLILYLLLWRRMDLLAKNWPLEANLR